MAVEVAAVVVAAAAVTKTTVTDKLTHSIPRFCNPASVKMYKKSSRRVIVNYSGIHLEIVIVSERYAHTHSLIFHRCFVIPHDRNAVEVY